MFLLVSGTCKYNVTRAYLHKIQFTCAKKMVLSTDTAVTRVQCCGVIFMMCCGMRTITMCFFFLSFVMNIMR